MCCMVGYASSGLAGSINVQRHELTRQSVFFFHFVYSHMRSSIEEIRNIDKEAFTPHFFVLGAEILELNQQWEKRLKSITLMYFGRQNQSNIIYEIWLMNAKSSMTAWDSIAKPPNMLTTEPVVVVPNDASCFFPLWSIDLFTADNRIAPENKIKEAWAMLNQTKCNCLPASVSNWTCRAE